MNENEKPKPKLRWRLLRWGLIGIVVLITLVAVLVTEENWRGKHLWDAYQREAAARGEQLDIASVIPPTVPDDQNFFYAPIVVEALKHSGGAGSDPFMSPAYRLNFSIYRGDSKLWPATGGYWEKGTFLDLKQWQSYFKAFNGSPKGKTNGFPASSQPQSPAEDVLLALSTYDPAVKDLREALQRPQARLPLHYENGLEVAGEMLPFLANVKRCGQFFQLRAIANLDAGHGAAALDDIKTLLALNDTIRNDPFLIEHLVRIAMFSIALQPIYEGLARHRWSDAELAALEQTLATQNFPADFQVALRGEKVFAIQAIDQQRLTRKIESYEESHGTNRLVTISLRWMPEAYFYQNQLWLAQVNSLICATLVDVTNQIVAPSALRRFQADIQAQTKTSWSPYTMQALATAPSLAAAVQKIAVVQANVSLARTACALERYRLAHGNYPETLDPLAPQFIAAVPHDIINGQPLHYHRTDDGKFLLYSVGWNESDDSGNVALTKNGSIDRKNGDWIW